MSAIISSCGRYRYVLTRHIPQHVNFNAPTKVLFIMLNPSTADDKLDDPTIRRCISFAQRERATEMTVVNLFALRATDPKELSIHPNPVGPLNDHYLREQMREHEGSLIIAAWGANKFAYDRAYKVRSMFEDRLWCLGQTKSGAPKHPLYLPGDSKLVAI